MILVMNARELIALRRTRQLSQRAAARLWGVQPNTIWRWENGLRPIPAWLEQMVARERRIENQEKEITALLLQMHRTERPPMGLARMGRRPDAVRGGRRARA
jgi:DNA-binding XRE family transcriptional regulator